MSSQSRPTLRRAFTALAGALVMGVLASLLSTQVPVTVESAEAADGGAFDPGYIISDAQFFDGTALNAAGVQAFLDARVPTCRATTGPTCLRHYSADVPYRAGEAGRCNAIAAAGTQSAARILEIVGQACGISQKSLIVLLEKEQGLVSSTAPTTRMYRSATGYGCPDTADCDAAYYGFFNQVYMAALQFKRYAANPTGWRYRAGQDNAILYHPNAACGSRNVYIRNQATAGLYIYTPYTPNAAALANLYGIGDGCSSYGNRNFWRMYSDWFGSPTGSRAPIGGMDVTTPDSGEIQVNGWTIDPDTRDPIDVHIYVDGAPAAVTRANAFRPDVGAAYPGFGNNHGISARVVAPTGRHQVCAYAIDTPGGMGNPLLGCQTVSIVNKSPFGGMDASSAALSGKITVRGWTIDPDTTGPIDVHVYVDGKPAVKTTANASRPDVGRHYPDYGAAHGIDVTFEAEAGQRNVCAYGINVGKGANNLLGCMTVNVDSMSPFGGMNVKTAHLAMTVNGWTIDPEETGPIDVHVYVDGAAAAVTRASASRPDVERHYPVYGPLHGIDVTFAATAGSHDVCAYGINVGRGVNNLLGCQRVTVPDQSPFGGMDARRSGSEIIVNGWTIDPDTTAPIDVHIYANGVGAAIGRADFNRPDVGRVYPAFGPNHGIDLRFPASAGLVQVCAYGINVGSGSNTLLGCQTVNPR